MLAEKQFHLWQYDGVRVVLHFVMCRIYGFPAATKWYEDIPEITLENDNIKTYIYIYIYRWIDRWMH